MKTAEGILIKRKRLTAMPSDEEISQREGKSRYHLRSVGKTGITQAELANRLGWTRTRIYEYESGCRTPKQETLDKIISSM